MFYSQGRDRWLGRANPAPTVDGTENINALCYRADTWVRPYGGTILKE